MKDLREKAINNLLEEAEEKLVRTELVLNQLNEFEPGGEEQKEQLKNSLEQQKANKAQLEKEKKQLKAMLDDKE